jgi:hypothetical protein
MGSRIPGNARHVDVEILDQRCRRVRPELTQLARRPVGEAAYLAVIGVAVAIRFQEIDDRVEPFVVCDEVARLLAERPLG